MNRFAVWVPLTLWRYPHDDYGTLEAKQHT